jgi:hypothetical protein
VPENFDSVAAIVAYVRRKRAEGGVSADCQASSE